MKKIKARAVLTPEITQGSGYLIMLVILYDYDIKLNIDNNSITNMADYMDSKHYEFLKENQWNILHDSMEQFKAMCKNRVFDAIFYINEKPKYQIIKIISSFNTSLNKFLELKSDSTEVHITIKNGNDEDVVVVSVNPCIRDGDNFVFNIPEKYVKYTNFIKENKIQIGKLMKEAVENEGMLAEIKTTFCSWK